MATRVVLNPAGIAALKAKVDRVGDRVTEAVAEDARRYAAVETGAMRGSIRAHTSEKFHGTVSVGTDHWQFVEYGTAAHIIEPVTKQALHWQGARHPVTRVHHPGTTPNPFMRPALFQRRNLGGLL